MGLHSPRRLLLLLSTLAAIAVACGLSAHRMELGINRISNQVGAARTDLDSLFQALTTPGDTDHLSPQTTEDLTRSVSQKLAALRLPGGFPSFPDERLRADWRQLKAQWNDQLRPGIAGRNADRPSFGDGMPPAQARSFAALDLGLKDLGEAARARFGGWQSFYTVMSIAGALGFIAVCLAGLSGRKRTFHGRPRNLFERLQYWLNYQKSRPTDAADPDLGRRNRPRPQLSLQLLNRVLTRLLDEPESNTPFILLLHEIEDLTGARSSAIFVCGDTGDLVSLLASTAHPPDPGLPELGQYAYRELSPEPLGTVQPIVMTGGDNGCCYGLLMPQGGQGFVLLLLKFARGKRPEDIDIDILQVHAWRLASVIFSTRRASRMLRNVQYEERAAIARELHDSLAQSLSYLKIQAGRLDGLIRTHVDPTCKPGLEIDFLVQDLRSNLRVAYRHLRELITTFRLTMHGRSFSQAVEDSVEEFANRSAVAFDLDYRLPAGTLNVDEEAQLLQIIREGLSNIVRHSHARSAQVGIYPAPDRRVRIQIEDDGVGMATPHDNDQHHGLIIMQERAHALGGQLHISPRPGGGTILCVVLTPVSGRDRTEPPNTSSPAGKELEPTA